MATNTKWYCDSTKYAAISVWAALTAVTVGQIRRQVSPAVGSERAFVCIIAGTTLAAEPTWTLTKGAKTAEAAGPTWQECTGRPAMNGDGTNTPTWVLGPKGVAVALGEIITDNAGTHYLICTTAGTSGSGAEPSWSFGAVGNTTADNTVTWTYLGLVSTFASTPWGSPFDRMRLPWASSSPWSAAGDTTWVGNSHAPSEAAAVTLVSPGTSALRSYAICVNNSVAPPTTFVANGASETTTGAANSLQINGAADWLGIDCVSCAGGVNNGQLGFGSGGPSNVCDFYIDNCLLYFAGTHPSGLIGLGSGSAGAIPSRMRVGGGVRYKLSNASHGITINGDIKIFPGTGYATGNVMGTTMFTCSRPTNAEIAGLDLTSNCTTGVILMANAPGGNVDALIKFLGPKMPAGWAAASGDLCSAITYAGLRVEGQGIDTGDNLLYDKIVDSPGIMSQETTTFTRTGGAAVPNSVSGFTNPQPFSWKFVTSSRAAYPGAPFRSRPIPIDALMTAIKAPGASTTLTLNILFDAVAEVTDGEIWAEWMLPKTSASSLYSQVSSAKATVMTAAQTLLALFGAGSGWTTTGMSNPKQRKVVLTDTPQEIAMMQLVICCAKPSFTFYADPLIAVS